MGHTGSALGKAKEGVGGVILWQFTVKERLAAPRLGLGFVLGTGLGGEGWRGLSDTCHPMRKWLNSGGGGENSALFYFVTFIPFFHLPFSAACNRSS